jgi:sugar phosphate permease
MIFQSTITYGFQAWAPTFFIRVHGWTAGQAGRTLGTIILISGCLGMYVGGRLGDYWQKRGMSEAQLMVVVPSAIGAGILFPLAMTAHSAEWTRILLFPAVFFQALPVATVVAAIQLIVPNQLRGQMSALFLFCLNLGGLSLGPLMPAILSDYLFKNEKMIGLSLAITIGAAAILTLAVFVATFRPYRTHYRMMHSAEPVATH